MSVNVDLFYFFNHSFQNPIFDYIMPAVTHLGGFRGIIVIVFVMLFYAKLKSNSLLFKITLLALISLLFSDLITLVLKLLIKEPRPYATLSHVRLLIYPDEFSSFPSGHATSTLSAAAIFMFHMKKLTDKYTIISVFLVIFAVIILFSRVYVGVHYPLDVIAGSLIGIAGALFINGLNEVFGIVKI